MGHVNVIWSRLYTLAAAVSRGTVMAESARGELTDADEKPTGETLTSRYLLVDTHIDVPYRLQNMPNQDVSGSTMRVWREVEAYAAQSE